MHRRVSPPTRVSLSSSNLFPITLRPPLVLARVDHALPTSAAEHTLQSVSSTLIPDGFSLRGAVFVRHERFSGTCTVMDLRRPLALPDRDLQYLLPLSPPTTSCPLPAIPTILSIVMATRLPSLPRDSDSDAPADHDALLQDRGRSKRLRSPSRPHGGYT